MNQEAADLTNFLGFDLYSWLKDVPPSRLVALFNTLLEAKLVNYKMIRTMTSFADITPSIRNAMQPMQRTALLDVVGVEYKPTREGLIWTYAVAYVFIRNMCKFMRRHPEAYLKTVSLHAIHDYDVRRLEARYASGSILRNTMGVLHAYPKFAYHVYTNFDKVTLACALQVLRDDEIAPLLQSVVIRAFSDDIIQLARGKLTPKDEYSKYSAQSKFVDSIFSANAKRIDKQKTLAQLSALDADSFSRCLYDSSLLDFGMYLRSNKTVESGELLVSLQSRLTEVSNYIVMATYEKRFNINYDEDLFFGNLASQIFQNTAMGGVPRNFSDYFAAME